MAIYQIERLDRVRLVIGLGFGDVSVGTSGVTSQKQFIGFSEIDEPVNVGDALDPALCSKNPLVILSFDNIESLEVVQRALNKIRSQLEVRTSGGVTDD